MMNGKAKALLREAIEWFDSTHSSLAPVPNWARAGRSLLNSGKVAQNQIWTTRDGHSFRVVQTLPRIIGVCRCHAATGELLPGSQALGIKRADFHDEFEYSGAWKGDSK